MKKIICIFCAVSLLTLSGCFDYTDIENSAIVSGISADRNNEEIILTYEFLETGAAAVIKSCGENFYAALKNMSAAVPREIFYSHTAVFVLGKNLRDNDIADIFSFLGSNNEITMLLRVVASANALDIFENKTATEKVVAYEIVSLLRTKNNNIPVGHGSDLINIKNSLENQSGVFAVPDISSKNEENTVSRFISGTAIYKNNEKITDLTIEETYVYELLTDKIKNGLVVMGSGKRVNAVTVKTTNLSTKTEKNKELNVTFNLNITLTKNNNYRFNKEEFINCFNMYFNSLIKKTKEENIDIFSLNTNIKDARFNVNINIKEEK